MSTRGGCNGLGIGADGLEAHTVDAVLAELDSPRFRSILAEGDTHADDRASLTRGARDIERRRTESAQAYAQGLISITDLAAVRVELDVEAGRVASELEALGAPVQGLDAEAIVDDWQEMTLTERRQVLRLLGAVVTVEKAKPGTRKFDPDRVTVVLSRAGTPDRDRC